MKLENSNRDLRPIGLISSLKTIDYEIKELGEICYQFIPGYGKITKAMENNGNYPAIICKDIFNSNIYIDECELFVDESTIETNAYVNYGDIVMANSGYTKNNTSGCCVFLGDRAFSGNNTYILKHNQNSKYLVYSLTSQDSKEQISLAFKEGLSDLMSLRLGDIKKFKIPIPSKELQEKIAKFLFKFALLDKKLKKELKIRKKQYEGYKNLIFQQIMNKKWQIKKISEISNSVFSGCNISRDKLETGDYPAIKYIGRTTEQQLKKGQERVNPDFINQKKYCEYGDILICRFNKIKDIVGKFSLYSGKEKCLIGDGIISIKHNQNPKYLFYSFSSYYTREQIESFLRKSIVFKLSPKDIEQLKIPLPNLEEQEKIVKILDKFYDICENPNKGILALIKHNQKQYEYYRDLIFSQMKVNF